MTASPHDRAIKALLAAAAGEPIGSLTGLLGDISTRPGGSENIPIMAYIAGITVGDINPEKIRPMLRGEGSWRHGTESGSLIYAPWTWAAVLWLHAWARATGNLAIELDARRWLRCLVARLALSAIDRGPQAVTYQMAGSSTTRHVDSDTASIYSFLPAERSAVNMSEPAVRSNTRIERSLIHPMLSGALGVPWNSTELRGRFDDWPLALSAQAVGSRYDARPSDYSGWGLTDFDRLVLRRHIQTPAEETAEYIARMIRYPQPPGVSVNTIYTDDSIIRWQSQSTNHVKIGHQGLLSLTVYHKPTRRVWAVTPYPSGRGLGKPSAFAEISKDLSRVNLWVADTKAGMTTDIVFPLPRFGTTRLWVSESNAGVVVAEEVT